MPTDRFPSPFDIATPEGAEGWESMYDWYHLFGPERRELDEQRFWFADRLHHPDVLHPYDEIQCECWWQALGAFNTRIFAMPPAYGVDQRILNGRLYVTPGARAARGDVAARAEEFGKRAGHYYERWDAIYAEWKDKVLARLAEIRALRFDPLPDLEPESTVYEHVGTSAGFRMIRDFNHLVTTMYETYQCHFELLNIGYAAYLTFFGMCKSAFPDISDQTISRMVGGLDVELYRPDDELKRLAKEAQRLGVDLGDGHPGRRAVRRRSRETDAGAEWVADWERTADPWFVVNTDPGHPGGYHVHPTWAEAPDVPLAAGARVRAQARQGRGDRPAHRRRAARARPDRGRVPRADGRGRPAGVRRDARAGPQGVRLHRGARALHRALDVGGVLGEVQGALPRARGDGRARRAGGHVLPAPLRGGGGDLRLRGRLVGGVAAARRGLLAPDRRDPPPHLRRAEAPGSRSPRSARRPPRSTSRSR